MRTRVLVGTRGSPLALAQANQVIQLLRKSAPNVRYEVIPIRTKGDKMHDVGRTAVEGKSLFTKEIEDSLLNRRVDVAIHSMKDLTTDLQKGLTVAAVPERANALDVLVSRDRRKFSELPGSARMGTSSPRRRAQLLAARGDLKVVEMHGNVDTRLHKLASGEYDAIVLAAAGLIRLGLEKSVTEILPIDIMLPAVGQGAVAIQSRDDDEEIISLFSRIDHQPTRLAVEAERAFARRLGAGCRTPIAAYARFEPKGLAIDGLVAAPSGRMLVRSRIVSDKLNPERVGEELADALLSKGAAVILEAA